VSIEGEIHVAVRWNGGEIERAELRSSRPFVAPRLLAGKTVAEACALVPLLFSICGRSQAIAAAAACDAAVGRETQPAVAGARTLLVAGEAMQEYLFRALIDWPLLRGEPPVAHVVAEARRRIASALSPLEPVVGAQPRSPDAAACAAAAEALRHAARVAAEEVFGEHPENWLAGVEASGVEPWAGGRKTVAARLVADTLDADPRFGASDVPLLPTADHDHLARQLAAAMDADAMFERSPQWRGRPTETGALARVSGSGVVGSLITRFGRSVLARLVARLVELAGLASGAPRANAGQLTLSPGDGIGWVETARGLLVHRARIAEGRVAGYRIVAPTEWNFHADGAVARGLRGARFADPGAVERGVRLLVQSLDPCVAARVEVVHA